MIYQELNSLDLVVKELRLILSYTYCSDACIILTSKRL